MNKMTFVRKALSLIPNPIAVLALNDGNEFNGMIASWITQISFDPPKILVAIHPNRHTHRMMSKAGFFTINLLAKGQEDRVSRFKIKGEQSKRKFDGLDVATNSNDQPYLPDSAAVLHCRLCEILEVGDHSLFVGEVTDGTVSDLTPLTTTSMGIFYVGQE